MRGEERARRQFLAVVEELDDRAGDRHAVERARAAAHFVEDHERSRRRLVEDLGGLDHLDHERRLPGRKVVLRADAREDAVEERQPRFVRGHERARLGHQRDERDLAQVGRLPAHVRAGEDQHLAGSSSSTQSFGTKRPAPSATSTAAWRPPRIRTTVSSLEDRARVAAQGGDFAEGEGEIANGDRVGDLLERRLDRIERLDECRERLLLEFDEAVARGHEVRFVLLQRLR